MPIIKMSRCSALIVFLSVLVVQSVWGATTWLKIHDNKALEFAEAIAPTPDGGCMVAEYQSITDSSYKARLVVKRLNANGAVTGTLDLGLVPANFGPRRENMLALPDGGCLLTGTRLIETRALIYQAIRVSRFDSSGKLVWERVIPEAPPTNTIDTWSGFSAGICGDGGFAIIGAETINGVRSNEPWIGKFDAAGRLQWSDNLIYKGGQEFPFGVTGTPDGMFMVAIVSHKSTSGPGELHMVKYALNKKILWDRRVPVPGTYSGAEFGQIAAYPDGSLQVVLTMGALDVGGPQIWLARFNSQGKLLWERTVTGATDGIHMVGRGLHVLPDGSFLIAGAGKCPHRGAPGLPAKMAALLLKFSSTGTLLWERNLGGNKFDLEGNTMALSSDGGIFLAGAGSPLNKKKNFMNNAFVLKTDADGNVADTRIKARIFPPSMILGPGEKRKWRPYDWENSGNIDSQVYQPVNTNSAPPIAANSSVAAGGNEAGLAMHLNFDDMKGSIVRDVSGKNRKAVINGGVTWAPGCVGNGSISIPPGGSLVTSYVPTNLTALSVSLWVKQSTSGTLLIETVKSAKAGQNRLIFSLNKDGVGYGIKGGPKGWDIGNSQLSDMAGQWHHVVGVWSEKAGLPIMGNQFDIYIDGQTKGQVGNSMGGGGKGDPTSPLIIKGAIMMSIDRREDPKIRIGIDDFRVYERRLSEAEIQSLYIIGRK